MNETEVLEKLRLFSKNNPNTEYRIILDNGKWTFRIMGGSLIKTNKTKDLLEIMILTINGDLNDEP